MDVVSKYPPENKNTQMQVICICVNYIISAYFVNCSRPVFRLSKLTSTSKIAAKINAHPRSITGVNTSPSKITPRSAANTDSSDSRIDTCDELVYFCAIVCMVKQANVEKIAR